MHGCLLALPRHLTRLVGSSDVPLQVINHSITLQKHLRQMKKETFKTIINFVITVLTAITSAFCVQSCM